MVKMLHTSIRADNWKFKHLLDVVSARAVCIGSLNNTNFELLRDASTPRQITDERSSKSSDTVSIKKPEDVCFIDEVVDHAIGIAIQGGTAIEHSCLG